MVRVSSPTCVICQKAASEIESYNHLAKEEGLCSADDAVKYLDNTYNFNDNLFCCPECYFKLNFPKGKAQYIWLKKYSARLSKILEQAYA